MVLSALPSPLRPGWLRIQTIGAFLGVALLVGACSAAPSPSPSSSASSTAGFTPMNQMTLRVRVASMAREMLVPGAVALAPSVNLCSDCTAEHLLRMDKEMSG